MTTKRPFFPIIIILLTISIVAFATINRETAVAEPQANPITPAYGINFISSADMQGGQGGASEQRYQNGLSTGAAWNRWPLYWNKIELYDDDIFHWEYQDLTVIADITHGLKIDAILLGALFALSTIALTLVFMVLKTGIHGHGPEFSPHEINQLIEKLPIALLAGMIAGAGVGLLIVALKNNE